MNIAIRLIPLIIGYAFGNISPGLIFAKLNGVDLRSVGSGNIGSTNVKRALGMKIGLLTLVCDMLKAVIPMIFCLYYFEGHYPGWGRLSLVYAGFGAVMGHLYPVVLKFNGGKGVATSGAYIAVGIPICFPITVFSFLAGAVCSKYISLGSCVAAILLPIQVAIFLYTGILGFEGIAAMEVFILYTIDAVTCFFKHRENIKRIIAGEERKFSFRRE